MNDSNNPNPYDPFDLDALRAEPLQDFTVEKMLTTVPVRRPGRSEFFRVHSDPQYLIDAYLFERTDGMDHERYWVSPAVREALRDELTRVRLYTCINKAGVVFLWPAKLPSDDGPNTGRAWHISALEAAEAAQSFWVCMKGNRSLGAYELKKARGDLGEPTWPDKTFRDLITIGFRDRIIETTDHPVIRELNGEI